MEPATKRKFFPLWEKFSLITPNKVCFIIQLQNVGSVLTYKLFRYMYISLTANATIKVQKYLAEPNKDRQGKSTVVGKSKSINYLVGESN